MWEWTEFNMFVCSFVCMRFVCEDKKKKRPNRQTDRQTNNRQAERRDEEQQTRSGRWEDGRVKEREKSIGETDGWGVSEKKDMVVSQHTQ